MGVYLANPENEWIYHSELGWLFVDLDQFGGLWMWMPDEKWLWTTKSVWPFLWSYSITGWIYPIYADGNRYFYDYTEGVIR